MEYTKDIILDVNYKRKEFLNTLIRLKTKTKQKLSEIKTKTINIYKTNKFVIYILLGLIILISVDIILINTFFNIIGNI